MSERKAKRKLKRLNWPLVRAQWSEIAYEAGREHERGRIEGLLVGHLHAHHGSQECGGKCVSTRNAVYDEIMALVRGTAP